MVRKAGWVGAGLTVAVLASAATLSVGIGAADAAVVYCKTVGVPKGCVMRRTVPAAGVVVTPGVGAPGVGVRAGTPMNRGGPVNRVGRR